MKNRLLRIQKGYTIVEILIVLALFAVITILTTQSLSLSLKGSRKSESSTTVRENLNTALIIMERSLINAKRIIGCDGTSTLSASPPCPAGTEGSRCVNYEDEYGNNNAYFACVPGSGTNGGYIASSSATSKISSDTKVNITNCSFLCYTAVLPHSVNVTLTGISMGTTGNESTQITVSDKILLRNY